MNTAALEHYTVAKAYVVRSGYSDEIRWQSMIGHESFTESDLLRESAWVILCSGFREKVVRRRFSFISLCFCDWESADAIVQSGEACVRAALSVFRNRRKIESIFDVAVQVGAVGFASWKRRITADPTIALQSFPYIGPITAHHLAKNLGFPVAKNDRHLQRAATFFGFDDATALCKHVAAASGDPLPVVDLVLWRFSVLSPRWYCARA